MGSLKDKMRGLREDHKSCEKTDDGERPGGSDGSAEPEGPQINTSQESTTRQPKLHMNASYVEERDKNEKSKDQELSGEGCVKESTQTDTIPLTQHTEDDQTTTATQNDMAVSNKFLSDGVGVGEIQGETSRDKKVGHDREKKTAIENILVPVPATPATPDPSDPRSPAPSGQRHMPTQVSLEVVQCRSAATSPMTPPEGGHSFFFPSSFGKSGAVGAVTKDAELQVGHQVEFCSVATSPMTPKTPSTTAFPELSDRETAQKQKEENVNKSDAQRESDKRESFPVTKSLQEAEPEITGALKSITSKEPSEGFSSNASPESSVSCTAAGLVVSPVTLRDSNQPCKQQRMGSMDQDITILVTHYGNNEEEEGEKSESSCFTIEPEMVKIDEYEELRENNGDVKREDGMEMISAGTVVPDVGLQDASNSSPSQNKTEESSVCACDEPKTNVNAENSEVEENKGECGELRDVTKPPVPESPAPFGCHNIRTQVSLEVVQCQSAATSPMTPPEGDQAFCFPSSLGMCGGVGTEAKDAELQVGPQVEFRSVATAPMTPRTPTSMAFPEIRKDASVEEKIVEEEEDTKAQVVEDKEEEKVTEEKKVEAAEEDTKEALDCAEISEEPVQEVSWDEKGMTWEVYGAVVEVAVLGSAIQKHLEKQVKKQKPSMPPPPPLNPSAMPLTSECIQRGSGSGKGRAGERGGRDGSEVSRRRRNPFRQLMENMQQPHCCSRAHTAE
ncbi:G protein-regulated inducer of neurite outgrowth 1 [Sander lucioperca]|uniref:G protein-regulated inducer of neurite outgrowth C-terminal domain-containing protein n=1 Tax=Sander lucioperca TaxID=283035 RepID=A0A8C9X3Y3_SANLU|nr:G protein-regulated inducer of neurite outgrowth 1 [Sander lucioperca]